MKGVTIHIGVVFDYVGRVQRGEIRLAMALAPFVATGAWVWWLSRVLPRFKELGPLWLIVIGALAAAAGLVLTSVAYPCSSCLPQQPGCQVVIEGWPLRQVVSDVDPEPVVFYDACRMSNGLSTAAMAANFAIAALGMPLLAALLRSRSQPRASKPGASRVATP